MEYRLLWKKQSFITSTLVVGITTAAPLVVASCSPEESKQPNDNTTNSGESNLKCPTTVKINLNAKLPIFCTVFLNNIFKLKNVF